MLKTIAALFTFLAISISANRFAIFAAKSCSSSFCGGVAAIPCCLGYTCLTTDHFPDSGGRCINTGPSCNEKYCGGRDNIKCCSGYICEENESPLEVPRKCLPWPQEMNFAVMGKPSACAGKPCGGFANVTCCVGSQCILDPHYPQAGGSCS